MLRKALCLAYLGLALLVRNASADAAEHPPMRILAFGDSLTAGFGLAEPSQAFPAQLERALHAKDRDVTLIQGGNSGDTSADGRARLEWSLAAHPDAVIVELGANDALRGLDPKLTADNIEAIVRRIQHDHIPVLLAGMLAPPNMGREYGDRFNAIFPKIAQDTGVLLYPFFLDGVAAVSALNQADHMHPTADGVTVIVERILPTVEKLLTEAERNAAAKPSKP
jgi:acyl-CoA thioesterase-1